MTKRRGASLINVMVFMMFAVMVTAQVFFFTKSSSDSLAEGREIMLYRLHLQSLVEEAKDALKETDSDKEISHDGRLNDPSNKFTFSEFFAGHGTGSAQVYTQVIKKSDGALWTIDATLTNNGKYKVSIHDLDYNFTPDGFNRSTWTDKENGYGNDNAHKKLFAAMPALSKDEETTTGEGAEAVTTHNYKITNRFYLIRAWTKLPENYYGARLMYQVLVSRDENIDNITTTYHNIETL